MANRFLVGIQGPVGVGKTTVGQIVARELDAVFVDWDMSVLESLGRPANRPLRFSDIELIDFEAADDIFIEKIYKGLKQNRTVVVALSDRRSSSALLTSFTREGEKFFKAFHGFKDPKDFPFAELIGFGLHASEAVLQERGLQRKKNWEQGRQEPGNVSIMPGMISSMWECNGAGPRAQGLDAEQPVPTIVNHIVQAVKTVQAELSARPADGIKQNRQRKTCKIQPAF